MTLKISLYGLSGKGNPKLMVKIKGHRVLSDSIKHETYDFKEQLSEELRRVELVLTPDLRFQENPDCLYSSYYDDGGSQMCGVYITVECGADEEVCGYVISLESFKLDNDKLIEIQQPP